MRWSTAVTELLGIDLPLVQAPMGGGPSTAELASAVSDAGGLGSIAGGYLSPRDLRKLIGVLRGRTSAPFAVNVFAGDGPDPGAGSVARVAKVLGDLRAEVGLPEAPEIVTYAESLSDQIEVLVAERPAVVSFTFGVLGQDHAGALHEAGCLLMGTATSVGEAVALEKAGVDLICAQGAEAGAHRGSFLDDAQEAQIGTMALVPQVCDAVSVPVVAAGGIMDGRGLAAALALGAGAAQLGTAYLRCREAGTAAPYRRALAAATDTSTRVTAGITGRPARGLQNRLMRALANTDVPPYPIMNALTAELRRAAASKDDPELMSLWCGQGVALGTESGAGELTETISRAARALLRAP